MRDERLSGYIQQMLAAAEQARSFTADMDEAAFVADLRTQMAVMMAFVLIGEMVAKIAAAYPEFLEEHTDVPWGKIKGMRNLIAHDDYEIELGVVWQAIGSDIPWLIAQLDAIRNWPAEEGRI